MYVHCVRMMVSGQLASRRPMAGGFTAVRGGYDPAVDELERYLLDLEEPSLDVKVLSWWQAKENK